MPQITLDIQALYNEAGEGKTEVMETFQGKKNLDVNIRPIKNGFIVRRSWDEPAEDENGRPYDRYQHEEEYYPTNPIDNK